MRLEELGYNSKLAAHRKEHHLESFGIGRVTSEHCGRYTVLPLLRYLTQKISH
ncbi:MAG: hypothetical protein GW827_00115 [Flavobacteriales bacterium]|nr:hypothetical protein [Flavobacteriales bacterium]NCP88678.1 hypothetical protein [Flavobacteriales bacterium]NCT14430.1 hypothetical protein [Flavobacteriales bacterium]